jgi:regulator of replication initiation timing
VSPNVLAILGIIVGPLVAYIVAARKLSGKVATSEATDLWEESRSIREDYADRIKVLNEVVKRCEGRIDELEERNDKLYLENGNLKRILEEHEATIAELRQVVHRLSDENDRLRLDNTALRKRVTELEGSS